MRNGSGSGPRDAEQPRVNNTVHSSQQAITNAFLPVVIHRNRPPRTQPPPVIHRKSQQAITNAFPLQSFIATGHHKRIPPSRHSSQQAITNAFPLQSFIATGHHERIPPSRHSRVGGNLDV